MPQALEAGQRGKMSRGRQVVYKRKQVNPQPYRALEDDTGVFSCRWLGALDQSVYFASFVVSRCQAFAAAVSGPCHGEHILTENRRLNNQP